MSNENLGQFEHVREVLSVVQDAVESATIFLDAAVPLAREFDALFSAAAIEVDDPGVSASAKADFVELYLRVIRRLFKFCTDMLELADPQDAPYQPLFQYAKIEADTFRQFHERLQRWISPSFEDSSDEILNLPKEWATSDELDEEYLSQVKERLTKEPLQLRALTDELLELHSLLEQILPRAQQAYTDLLQEILDGLAPMRLRVICVDKNTVRLRGERYTLRIKDAAAVLEMIIHTNDEYVSSSQMVEKYPQLKSAKRVTQIMRALPKEFHDEIEPKKGPTGGYRLKPEKPAV